VASIMPWEYFVIVPETRFSPLGYLPSPLISDVKLTSVVIPSTGWTFTTLTTTTGALGTQSDIVLFSLVRNNPEKIVGAVGTLQDLNVAISRSKEKLIIFGNFDMMLNGWSGYSQYYRYWRKSSSRALAQLVDSKYGRVIETPPIIRYT
jgi:hypothetical protein